MINISKLTEKKNEEIELSYLIEIFKKFEFSLKAQKKEDFIMKINKIIKDHLILISDDIDNITHICLTLRSKLNMNSLIPIIILSSFDEYSFNFSLLFEKLKFLKNIYFISGNKNDKTDLKKSGIFIIS
jgi:hypothetical protein